MKLKRIAFCFLFCLEVFANPFQTPPGAVLKKSPRPSSNLKGILECQLFHTRVEHGEFKETEFLFKEKSEPFEIGILSTLKLAFPYPYQNISVLFNHAEVSYNGEVTWFPYLQAFFLDGTQVGPKDGLSDLAFDLKTVTAGSKLLLRRAYRFSSNSLLSYQCSLSFL